jgi:nucleoside-diphosphate-sugar epimerase
MKVFVAGATGAIGKQLVPRLVAAGHEVVGRRFAGRSAPCVLESKFEYALTLRHGTRPT